MPRFPAIAPFVSAPAQRWRTIILLAIALICATVGDVRVLFAQAGFRESLERLDRDQDGEISPDEITPLARPYLERIAEARRISLEKPNSIQRLQDAARVYHAIKNGVSGRNVRPEPSSTVRPFGPERGKPVVPEFGLRDIKYPYTIDDLEEADQTLRRYDRNRDGYIDRPEAMRSRWTHRNPFDDDLNQDDRLSRLELAQRYARRRLLSDDSDELVQRARRTESMERSRDDRRDDSRSWYRNSGSRNYLTASLLARFDVNRNGRLDANESESLGVPLARLDIDRDGELTRDELHAYVSTLEGEEGALAEGVPAWFYELDANRDRQVAMAEFTTDWTEARLAEFDSLDLNGDGLLTENEARQAGAALAGGYRNDTPELIPPRRTIISEIEIDDDATIGDLDLQMSLTHTYVSRLDAYLTGPDGTRIELFTEIGGSGDHFDQTIFDDQAKYPITKARAPHRGRYQPEGRSRGEAGLSAFTGKNARGVWQLVIRGTRSERFGMLHRWSLQITPSDQTRDTSTVLGQFSDLSGEGFAPSAARPNEREGGREEEEKRTAASESRQRYYADMKRAYNEAEGEERAKVMRKIFMKQLQDAAEAKRAENPSDEEWARYKSLLDKKAQAYDRSVQEKRERLERKDDKAKAKLFKSKGRK